MNIKIKNLILKIIIKLMSNVDKNKSKKNTQTQQDSELTRFGHTVTLSKLKI